MYKLLIVEDEYNIRRGLSRFDWNSLGIELVGECEHGLLAYKYISENSVDIVLTDIHMPIMGGLELAKLISENYPYISTIMLTGYSNFEYARESMRYGVIDYLVKPVEVEEIKNTFIKVINNLDKKQQYITKYEAIEKKNRIFSSVLRRRFLETFLNKPMKKHEIEEGFYYSEMSLENNCYAVMLFRLDGYIEKEIFYDESELRLISFAFENISSEFAAARELGYPWVNSSTLECYILILSSKEQGELDLPAIAQEFKDTLYDIAGIIRTTISCGIGSVQTEIDRVIISSEQARKALSYKSMEDDIVIYKDSEQEGAYIKTDSKADELESNNYKVKEINIESSKPIIEKAVRYIQENYMKSITLDEVAGKVYLNPAYFSYLFKNVCGINFINYVTNYRINKAKVLLKDSALKVQQVSEAVGYESSRYFTQIFKRHTGFTPNEFRCSMCKE